MFCHHCHYEFYVPGDTLGAKIRCPNCTGTLQVEDKQLLYPCPECGGMLDVALWMIGSVSTCPHCQKEITLSLGEESCKFFPGDAEKQKSMLRAASKKAGDVIGKYRVIRCLGIGGMGEVYLVEHTLLNTRCALKLLKSEIARQDPEMRARLLREARLASQIQHPNLIAVLDAELDENSDSCYIVMEYVDGVSIENILVDGPMLEQRSLEIVYAVAEALREAAQHKIIHRDIKPANIMLSSTGEVKLADLGIAKVESDNKHNMTLTMDNAVLGTPNYASPEQLRSSHRVDSRADIYSLGATLYHMLTGKRPFEADSVFGVMANVLEKDIPPVHSVNPAISVRTSDLIGRMMAKKRENRPADFDELLKELQSGKRKFHLPKIGNIRKLVSLKNIWSLFLGFVAIAGLCVAGTRLYWYYLDRQKNALEEQEEQAQASLARRHYRRPLRPENYISKVVRPTSIPEKPVEKTVDVQVPENGKYAVLIKALREADIRKLKSLVASSDNDADLEICLNFTRAALRLDYARCEELLQKFRGNEEVEAVLNKHLMFIKRYWTRELNGLSSQVSFYRNNNPFEYEMLVDVIGYSKTVNLQSSSLGHAEKVLQSALQNNSGTVKNSRMNHHSLFGMNQSLLTLRRYLTPEFVNKYAGHRLDEWRLYQKYSFEMSVFYNFYNAHQHAILLSFLDNGYPIDDDLKAQMRDFPQLDDFVGEEIPVYDYSMMTIKESEVADFRKIVSEMKSGLSQSDYSETNAYTKSSSLIQALHNLDIKFLKSNVSIDADAEACLNFARAALRLDYVKCRYLAHNFRGSVTIKRVFDEKCRRLEEFWQKKLKSISSIFLRSCKRTNSKMNVSEGVYIENIINYMKDVRMADLAPDLAGPINNAADLIMREKEKLIKQNRWRESRSSNCLSEPFTLRVSLTPENAYMYLSNISFPVERLREKYDISFLQSASIYASLLWLLDNGYQLGFDVMEELRKFPQFDDFTGEKAPAYDYSMMTEKAKSVVAELVKKQEGQLSHIADVGSADSNSGFVDFDFGNLKSKYKKEFIPDFLDNGVLKMDGLYPASLSFREKHGANAKSNEIKLDKALGDDFTVSMVFYPQAPIQSRMRRRVSPLLVVSRMYRVFVLQMDSDNRLEIVVNNHHPVFKTDMAVEMDKWNSLQVVMDSNRKVCKVVMNGNTKEIALGADFKFNVNASRKEVLFYNYSNGGAFRGMVKYLRLDYKALNGAELTAVSRLCGEEINNVNKQLRDIAKNEAAGIEKNIENLKKALQENNEHTIRALAREISAELKEKIKQLSELERYDECEKLLKACNAAQRPESSDYWNMIGNVFYERYCEAMRNSNNRKIEKIYNAWRWANRIQADRIHIVYSSFEYQFLRMNYRIAKSILDRDRRTPEKVTAILKERLNIAISLRQNELLNMFNTMCNPRYYWVAKELADAMHDVGISDSNISAARKRLRNMRNAEKSPKRSELRAFTERAIGFYDVVFEKCLNAHENPGEVEAILFREIDLRHSVPSNNFAFKRRLSALKCMLIFIERNKLPASRKNKLEKIPELADFVIKK